MDKSLEFLATYSQALSYNDLPASTIRAVKHRFIDSIGCAIGAYLSEPAKLARRLCLPADSSLTARIIGSLVRTTPEMAAFANSTMVRYLDFNDSYRMKGVGHPSDSIPAVLAIGEAVHVDGEQLITATTLAYEMQVLFIEKMPVKEEFDGCALGATVGSTLGAGKILGLNKEQFGSAAAMALVANHSLRMRSIGEMSMWKGVYAGMAARQGVFTAIMAREGITGPGEAIEGEYGLAKQMIASDTFSLEPLGGNGTQYAVERPNLKSYPVRDAIQLIINTALDLREKVSANEIESLSVKTYASAYVTAKYKQLWRPQTRETADHSMPFCVAAALIDGDITPETFSRERFRDPDVLELMGRMRVEVDPEFSKQAPGKRNCHIEAKTSFGETRAAHRVLSREDLQKRWPDEQVEAKFLGQCNNILTPAQARQILDLLWHLEDMKDTAEILDLLLV